MRIGGHRIKEWTLWEKLLFMFLLVEIALVIVSNLTLIDQSLDCDKGLTSRYAVECWRNHKLLMKDWTYQTTLEIDCSTLLAIPLYGLTHNIFLSYGVANIVYVFLLLFVLAVLFSKERPAYFLLTAVMICIPYEIGMLDYYDMFLFGIAYYNLRVFLPILLMALLLYLEREEKFDRLHFALVVLYVLLSVLSNISSGIYVTVTAILPATAAYLFWKLVKCCERISNRVIFLLLVPVVSVPVGLYVNRLFMGGSREQQLNLCSVYEMLGNVSSAFFGMFELFGGLSPSFDTPVVSLIGIKRVAKIVLVIIFLICAGKAVFAVTKNSHMDDERGKNRLLMKGMLVSVFLWNLFILIITKTRAGSATSEFRYHLIGMIPLLILSVIVVLDGLSELKKQARFCMCLAVTGFVAVISVASWHHLFAREELCVPLKEFCAYCSEKKYDYIYMFKESDNANICRAIDTERVYLYVSEPGLTYDYLFYDKYIDAPMEVEKSILAVDTAIADFGDTFSLGEFTAVYMEDVGSRKMYRISRDIN